MIIELLNGQRFDIASYDLELIDYNIPSLEVENQLFQAEGSNVPILLSSNYKGRSISVLIAYHVKKYKDLPLLRDVVNDLFTRLEPFYIVFKSEPQKRWLVKSNGQYILNKEDIEIVGESNLNFLCVNPYAESVVTTVDHKEWDINDTNTLESTFSIFNLGNVVIDPRENELEITIVATAANLLTITNITTGDIYTISGPFTTKNTIKLTGIRTTINNVSNYGRTNGGLITLTPGENKFTIAGGTLKSITFKYRNLYK